MEILYLDGHIVDLPAKKIAQNLQINDLAEVKDRQSNYTNRFDLPFTPRNREIMDLLGMPGSASTRPYSRIPAKLISEGVELISEGYVRVSETSNSYQIVIYDGNIGLAEALKGKKLNDLNVDDLNHTLTEQIYIDSFSNTEGYIYAIGDYGVRSPSSIVQIDYQAPSIFLHTIWDKIFTDAGLEYAGDIFQDESFLAEVVGPANGYDITESVLTSEHLIGMEDDGPINRSASTPGYQTFEDAFTFTYDPTYSKVTIDDNESITMAFNGRLKIDISHRLTIGDGLASIVIYKNGKQVRSLGITGIPLENSELYLLVSIGDRITAKALSGTARDGVSGPYELSLTAELHMDLSEQTGGWFIDFSDILPDTSQLDFVKDVMQRYGMIYRQARNSGLFEFKAMEDILNDREGSEDWSDKQVRVGKEEYQFGSYAQTNKVAYQYEQNIKKFDYDGEMVIDNDLLEPGKTLFTSIHKIRERSFIRNGLSVYKIPLWEEVEEDEVPVIKSLQSEISLFKLERKSITITYKLYDSGATDTFTGEIPFLSLNLVQLQYYLNRFYKGFIRMLSKPRKRLDYFWLNSIDIYNIDFFKLKYIKQLGQYYYLNKVVNFQNGKVTACELIQVNGQSVNSPPTQLGYYTQYMPYEGAFNVNISHFTTLTTPPYFDPEYDEPEMIRITGGFDANVEVEIDGVVKNSSFEFDANDFDLSFTDLGGNTDDHGYIFPFKIKSFGSIGYSDVTGEIRLNVRAKVQVPPDADAGPDASYAYSSLLDNPDEDGKLFNLDGSGSSDNEAISSYAWAITSQPAGSDVSFFSANTVIDPTIEIIGNGNQIGTYVFELTVTDNDGLTDTDQVNITIT